MNVFLRKLLLYVPVKMVPALSGIFLIFFLYKYFPAGQYVSYSVSLFCSLIAAQLSAGWVGNSFIYYYTGVEDKRVFVSNCVSVILLIAPVASLLAATVSVFFVFEQYVFICVWLLCFGQILFFFLSSACQADFLVKQQLVAVLLQALAQILLIVAFFQFLDVDFRYALLALSAGYFIAAFFLLFVILKKFGVCNPFSNVDVFKDNLRLIYQYGAALSPWILGMLVVAGSDRFAIGYYGIEHGDSYLSLKDLFVGGAGLLSMPLLMMVHPFVIKRFREGVFAVRIIESSSSFLIVAFSLLWCALYFVGFDFFERVTGKTIEASKVVILFSFSGVFLNSTSVYFQKRLEVHRRMKLLAYLSMVSALVSMLFAWIGGRYWGLYGVSLGVLLAQTLYFVLVTTSMFKRLDLYRSFTLPALISSLAFFIGYVFYMGLENVGGSLLWWEKSVFWLVGFAVVSLFSLWKGVRWSEFMKATV
ncbi:lipopolysaccharide biosynthesis protein [Pseudomonas sp. 6D_7.1_Bac1]|uniref:lipopolysaccharide biosynthesis protein n=1 Tax=Pseudomonas sp. 6D_7.1_Bac1 TaxID=2971615 RepID=UPI0021C61935|nr:sugar transporter [Pseudomonas sp. 6D_7.1_Bac1]MCU1748474.1 sugar transporter [Pseudomonas sp. 6D_7.1_Bac1]